MENEKQVLARMKSLYLVVVCLAVFFLIWLGVGFRLPQRLNVFSFLQNNSSVGPEEIKYPRALTLNGGVLDADLAARPLIAVVIENHPDSRPQSGLGQAEIVFETLAEGGITRFLAIFQQKVDSIGPVRSARPYFTELANSFHALFVHVGGSPQALQRLKIGEYKNLLDINEFYHANVFDRIKLRKAPHNAYTDTKRLYDFATASEFNNNSKMIESRDLGFQFVDQLDLDQSKPMASQISIDFSKPQFLVSFQYNSTTKFYQRFVGGVKDVDFGNDKEILPRTVIFQSVGVSPVPGDVEGRVDIITTGNGKAYIFNDGRVVQGLWNRDKEGVVKYSDSLGDPIVITPGQIWVALAPLSALDFY